MSENGPYNQPPQNPYGGDGSGGQPPYGPPPGGPYGDPHTGGQPGYAPQGAYTGGQPAYGPPGGYPPPQQPKSGGKAALWVVIGGGAVIVVLVVALIIMLATNRGEPEGGTVASPPENSAEANDPGTDEPEEPVEEPEGGGGAAGEPPYALPIEPCEALTDRVAEGLLMGQDGSKSNSDNRSSCSDISGAAPEGNPDTMFGTYDVTYQTPYAGSDSIEGAKDEFEDAVADIRGQSSYSLYDSEHLDQDKEVALGDEAVFVTTKYDFLGQNVPRAAVLIRSGNVNIEVTYTMSPSFDASDEDVAKFTLPDDIEATMTMAGEDALALLASA
ncbi:DUF3558 domain-containing protein [Nocardiopsis sp. CC223A]|uniref:DUF3558 domain-containing protein n=1 Tax=Nocardiopsis sp. CC223A TaxID=3044051 RepID=UPI00278C8594|nr:DUF3558 domain-containing protein [Nocardiopsis sp. CC223A]